jgi:CRISPR/Cas system-associated protein Cas10 (large subunit of type III CRISPR-Cas system)
MSKIKISRACRIPLSILLTYLKYQDSNENQSLQAAEVLERVRIRGEKHDDLEDELFKLFCFA